MGTKVGFIGSDGSDLGDKLVPKSYLIDNYSELTNTFRFAGLWLWGHGGSGKLGNNSTANQSSPVQTISTGPNWKQVAIGYLSSSAIKTDGTLWLWGHNHAGQLGTNDIVHRSSPVQTVAGGTNWKQVSMGRYHTAAIKTDGTLWSWGFGLNGQMGNNAATSRSSPVQTISGGTNWKQVSGGGFHTAAIKTDGTLWSWGVNASGNLGNNNTVMQSSPVQTISGGTNWKLVVCGAYNVASIKTDGTLWLWGSNTWGQLGDDTTAAKSSPVQTVAGGTNWKQVSGGMRHTAAIKTDGTLWLWGDNQYNQLGVTGDARSSPVQTIAGGTNWLKIDLGAFHTAAIKTDGTLWLWGSGYWGQLGGGSSGYDTHIPSQTISAGTNWKQVSGGGSFAHTAAIRDDSGDLI